MDIVTAIATRVRRERFERTGRGKAYDPDHPLHETELDDARAALAAMLEAVGEPVGYIYGPPNQPYFSIVPGKGDLPVYSLAALREEL